MKKRHIIGLISIALILLSYTAHSQIKLGMQLGANFANAKVANSVFEFESKTHFVGGVLAEFKISNMFYIQPEINYFPKGPMIYYPLYNEEIDYTFNYIEIPINVLVKFDVDNFTPFLFAGPSLSSLTKANVKSNNGKVDISEGFEKTDFSMNFGAGAEFILSNSTDLFIMARYSLGLTDISRLGAGEFKNQSIAITAGLKFSI